MVLQTNDAQGFPVLRFWIMCIDIR
jgi:hypothetical protein